MLHVDTFGNLSETSDKLNAMECWTSILTLTFGTNRTAQFSALSVGRNLSSFMLEAEWTPGQGITSFEVFKNPTGNRAQDFPSCGATPPPTATSLSPHVQIELKAEKSKCLSQWVTAMITETSAFLVSTHSCPAMATHVRVKRARFWG
jgi:hypothetical protein